MKSKRISEDSNDEDYEIGIKKRKQFKKNRREPVPKRKCSLLNLLNKKNVNEKQANENEDMNEKQMFNSENEENEKINVNKIYVKPRKKPKKMAIDPKRRRINRLSNDATNNYKCDSFLNFTSEITNFFDDITEEDEVDNEKLDIILDSIYLNNENKIIKNDFNNHANLKNRNLAEVQEHLKKQNEHSSFNLFAEKLADFSSYRTIHGNSRSMIETYHPTMIKNDEIFKISPIIIWKQPFEYLVYQKIIYDQHRNIKKLIENNVNQTIQQRRYRLLSVIKNRVKEIQYQNSQQFYAQLNSKHEIEHENSSSSTITIDEMETNCFNEFLIPLDVL